MKMLLETIKELKEDLEYLTEDIEVLKTEIENLKIDGVRIRRAIDELKLELEVKGLIK
jgi:cell division protein FtsB